MIAAPSFLFQVVLELAAPTRVTQLAQRFRLDLTDAFARHVEFAADLFECASPSVFESLYRTIRILVQTRGPAIASHSQRSLATTATRSSAWPCARS
jgi:hypothetical protein